MTGPLRAAGRATAGVVGAGALAGLAVAGYALLEARAHVLRRVEVPVLAAGEEPITVLHLSDLHLTDRTEARVKWVRGLAALHPDVVVVTGDNLSFASGLEPLTRALAPFLERPGAFVLGDHDYLSTSFHLPLNYLRQDPRTAEFWRRRGKGLPEGPGSPGGAGGAGLPSEGAGSPRGEGLEELPWREVVALQSSGGWADLTNRRGELRVRGRAIELVGVDDPHADRDRYPDPGPSPADAPRVRSHRGGPLRLGLAHSPYRRVLDAMAADDVDLAMAGHTHGGQLCLPGWGALVTNCDIDPARASGLSQYPGLIGSPEAADHMYLHVSAGLGTSPFTPVRLACRPEATLLTLLPSSRDRV